MDIMRSNHLKTVGLDHEDQNKIDSLLMLASRRLEQEWQLASNDNDANAFLVGSVDLLKPDLQIPCIYYTTEDPSQSPNQSGQALHWPLQVDEFRMPRLGKLVEALNSISQHLGSSQSSTDQTPDTTAEEFTETSAVSAVQSEPPLLTDVASYPAELEELEEPVEPEEQGAKEELPAAENEVSFLDLLIEDRKGYWRYSFVNEKTILIDGDKKQYYSQESLEQLKASLELDTFSAEELSSEEFLSCAQSMAPEPLAHLKWYVALIQPTGPLAEAISGKLVGLKRWPNMGLPGCRPLVQLAAFMQSNVATVETIAERTKQPVEQVLSFINACHTEELLHFGDEETIHEKSIDSNFKSLMKRILKRIN